MNQRNYRNRNYVNSNGRYAKRRYNNGSKRYETPTVIVVNGENPKKKRFNWVSLILILIGLICVGLSTYFLGTSFKGTEENSVLIQASAETVSGADDDVYFDLSSQTSVVKKGEENLAVRYTLARSDITDSQTFSLENDCYSKFRFTVSLSNDDNKAQFLALVYSDRNYHYFYVYRSSYPGYAIDFNVYSRMYPVTVGMNDISADYTFDGYYCVGKAVNTTGKVLPWTENKITFDLYGSSIDPVQDYEVKVDYEIMCRSNETFKVYDSADGWEGIDNFFGNWTNELVGAYHYENKLYLISTFGVNIPGNQESISYSECEVNILPLTTKPISLKTVCKAVFDAGNAVTVFGAEGSTTYEYANDIVKNVVTKSLTIRYLENIPFTPFAHMKEVANVEITYADTGTISLGAVKKAFEKKGLAFPVIACNSAIDCFRASEDSLTYTADYLSSVYVGLKTEEGKIDYKTLDCNQSFAEFYSPIKDTLGEIFPDGKDFLEVVVNNIIVREYPILKDSYELDEYDNLYGLWGWGVLPHTQAFNLNDLFFANKETKTENVLKAYTFAGNMMNNQYTALLESYGYSEFYQKINGTADWFKDDTNCTYLVFFCDGGEERTVISQSGNTDLEDDDPAWKDKVQDGWNDFLNGFSIFKDPKKILAFLGSGLGFIGGVYLLYLGFMKIRGNKNG